MVLQGWDTRLGSIKSQPNRAYEAAQPTKNKILLKIQVFNRIIFLVCLLFGPDGPASFVLVFKWFEEVFGWGNFLLFYLNGF